MSTRNHWGFRFLVAGLIGVAAPLLVLAPQAAYPPNGPAIPIVKLTGGGPPPTPEPAPGPTDKPSQWNMEIVGHKLREADRHESGLELGKVRRSCPDRWPIGDLLIFEW